MGAAILLRTITRVKQVWIYWKQSSGFVAKPTLKTAQNHRQDQPSQFQITHIPSHAPSQTDVDQQMIFWYLSRQPTLTHFLSFS